MNAFLVVDVQNDFISGSLNISNCSAQQNGIEVSARATVALRNGNLLFMLSSCSSPRSLNFSLLISGSHDDGSDQRLLFVIIAPRGGEKVLKLTSPSSSAYCRRNLDLIEFSVVLVAISYDKRGSQWKPNIRLHAESSLGEGKSLRSSLGFLSDL
jgi:hypothetical protein